MKTLIAFIISSFILSAYADDNQESIQPLVSLSDDECLQVSTHRISDHDIVFLAAFMNVCTGEVFQHVVRKKDLTKSPIVYTNRTIYMEDCVNCYVTVKRESYPDYDVVYERNPATGEIRTRIIPRNNNNTR